MPALSPAFHLPPLTTVQKCPTVVANTNRAGDEPHQERISLPLHCAGKVSAAKPHFKHLGSVGRQAALKTPWLCLTSCSTLNAKTPYFFFAKMFRQVPALPWRVNRDQYVLETSFNNSFIWEYDCTRVNFVHLSAEALEHLNISFYCGLRVEICLNKDWLWTFVTPGGGRRGRRR